MFLHNTITLGQAVVIVGSSPAGIAAAKRQSWLPIQATRYVLIRIRDSTAVVGNRR